MKAIVFNTTDSRLDKRMEAITLKAGYLLSQEVYTAGSTGFEIFFKECMADLPVMKQLSMLESTHKENPEKLETLQKARQLLKESAKVKYKGGGHIAAIKKIEKMVGDLWMESLEDYEEYMYKAGFAALKELAEEGLLKAYSIDPDPEDPKSYVTASNLLQRLLPDLKEDEEPEIFVAGAEFMNECCHLPKQDAANADALFLHHCFTLPNINALTSSELKTVHKQLQQAGALFTQYTDEWIDMCYFNDDITDRTAFFKNNILPAAAQLQESIYNNEILRLCSRLQNDAVKLNAWLGEVPVWQLWNYYKQYDVVKESTWSKLQTLKNTEAYYKQRWPVIALEVPKKEAAENRKESDEIDDIVGTKKYLQID